MKYMIQRDISWDTTKTEAKINGKRQLVDTQKGNYTTLYPV